MRISPAGRALLVAALLIVALGVRVAQVQRSPFTAVDDARTYNQLASDIARTGDYSTSTAPGVGAAGSRGPTAYFPPAYPYFLAAVDLLDGHQAGGKPALHGERLAQTVLGAIAVGLIGLVALEAFGPVVALVSLALAAVYPVLIELSGTLVAENLLVVLELSAVWAALRLRRAMHPYRWIAALGVLTGLATLTHENAILLLIPLGFAIWSIRPRLGGRALAGGALLIVTTVMTIAPWTIRNAIEVHRFIPVSDETGITLVGTYNPSSAAARSIPYKWLFFAFDIPSTFAIKREASHLTEPELGDKLLSQAEHYVSDHPLAPLVAAYHDSRRLFELGGSFAWRSSAATIGLQGGAAQIGVISFWILGVLALVGAFTRVAHRAPRWLWSVPILFMLSVVFVNTETPRFREPIDPFVILLAGCALATLAARADALRGSPVGRRGRPALAARDRQLVEVVERLA